MSPENKAEGLSSSSRLPPRPARAAVDSSAGASASVRVVWASSPAGRRSLPPGSCPHTRPPPKRACAASPFRGPTGSRRFRGAPAAARRGSLSEGRAARLQRRLARTFGTIKTQARRGGLALVARRAPSGYPTLLPPPEGARGVQCLLGAPGGYFIPMFNPLVCESCPKQKQKQNCDNS